MMPMTFEEWLIETFGFDGNYVPINKRPPVFVRPDGFFDVRCYEKWLDLERTRWEKDICRQALSLR